MIAFLIIMSILTVLNIWWVINNLVEDNSDVGGSIGMLLLGMGCLGWGMIGGLGVTKDVKSNTSVYKSTDVSDGVYITHKDNNEVITDTLSYKNWKTGKGLLQLTKEVNVYGYCLKTKYKIVLKGETK